MVREPYNGLPATWGNGTQVSLLAASPDVVRKAWETAVRLDGLDEGEPGLRTRYAADFFAAYFRDPEGNKLCFVFTELE